MDKPLNAKPFNEFYAELQRAELAQYASRPETRVRSDAAFAEQKQHLLGLYAGVNAAHSFVDAGGQVFDCIPADQQPALKKHGGKLAAPPAVPTVPKAPGVPAAPTRGADAAALVPARRDAFGNEMSCPAGTVPIRRVTLEELTRFETLGHFLRKHGHPRQRRLRRAPQGLLPEAQLGTPHEYAHAYQSVSNLGGHSVMGIWHPSVTSSQIFSLSQHWYVAQGPWGVQTVEVGWQVYPSSYGHDKPVLFTYWTADEYHSTGSYSTTAGDFVQYGANHPVGMAIESWSEVGGSQVELEITVMLHDGNWWIFVGGTDDAHAVGYYPTSLYKGGPMATGATEIDYGGETVGNGSYPPMGSGEFAERGYKFAAYQRNIYYIASDSTTAVAQLTSSEDWPDSYTIQVGQSTDWGEYFYYGGPGSGTASPRGESPATAASGRLTMTAPCGVKLENLSIRDAAALLRQLSVR